MNAKRNLVSFLAIATLLILATSMVSALATDDFDITKLEVDGVDVLTNSVRVIAGETITVKVYFTALDATSDGVDNDGDSLINLGGLCIITPDPDCDEADESAYSPDASDVKIRLELDGEEGYATETISKLVVQPGISYVETLRLEVPEVDEDLLSEDMDLTVKIWNSDFETEDDAVLRVQRPSYNVEIRSVLVSNTIAAGQRSPIDVVLENTGYNDLEDLYVTVRILELDVETRAYFGDLSVSDGHGHHHDDDSVRLYLDVPYDVASGIYTLEVEVYNEDFSVFDTRQVTVTNEFPEVVMKSGDNLLLLNPTNNLKVYKVVYPSADLIVDVQAGLSKLVPITIPEGEYTFDVFVFDGDKLVGTVNFSGTSEAETLASPVVVLTVILAVIFLVLLVVMIVLITKKPEKAEEFGESYY